MEYHPCCQTADTTLLATRLRVESSPMFYSKHQRLRCPHVLSLGLFDELYVTCRTRTQEVTLFGPETTNTPDVGRTAILYVTWYRYVVHERWLRRHTRNDEFRPNPRLTHSTQLLLQIIKVWVLNERKVIFHSNPKATATSVHPVYSCMPSSSGLVSRHSRHRWPSRPTGSSS